MGLLLAWGTAYGLAVATLVLGVLRVPQLLLVLVVIAAFHRGRRFVRDGWTFGTARWAGFWELLRAEMLEGDGVLLGKVEGPKLPGAGRILISRQCSSWLAINLFLRACRRSGMQAWVRTKRGVHMCVCAPSGRGKTQSFVVPIMLTHSGSIVAIDPRGELYRLTAERRRAMGYRNIVLDPFRQVTDNPDRFNPLDFISADSPLALDDCRALGEAMIVRDVHEEQRHWNDSAELWVWTVITWLVLEAPPDLRNLQTVARLLASPAKMKEAIELIRQSSNPLVERLADQLTNYMDRELGSTMTTTNRHLRFLGTPALVESTTSSTFDPAILRQQPTTIYLVLPTEFLRTQSALMRLWITSLLRACIRGGANEDNKVLFLLDEFPTVIGNMECIEDAVVSLRGFGVRLAFIIQSLGQLEKCFPKGVQTFLSCMDTRVYFGLNDYQSADLVCNEIGAATVPVLTENGGWSSSKTADHHGHQSTQRGESGGWSLSHTSRKLLFPDEILRLNERTAIVFANGMVFTTRLVRAYEREFIKALPKLKGGE